MDDGPVPLHRLEVPAPHLLPFAIGSFDTIGPLSRAGFPHRHTFYEIVHVTGGTGAHVIDLSRWELRPPHLCFVVPGQVHYWEDVSDLQGVVILFTDDFLLDHPADRDVLRMLGERPWLSLSRADMADLAPLVADMEREYALGRPQFAAVLRAFLHVLILRAARMSGPGGDGDGPGSPRRADAVAQEFVRLLAGPGSGVRSVRSWASQMGVTVGYLNEVVKHVTGRTPGQLVRQTRTHEAKRLLALTDLTVRQVAGEVGFSDPAYFCRYFRRETGLSPSEFRRGSGALHHDYRIPSIDHPRPPA
ncbi:AraC family transcriptional regulator [Streptomyces enissocaesilis]|uniref:AraC family transcriptional regulator n=1 Tax=Streptomyces enissocaesilis TaxID=332589 RepID=A0ABN3X2L0_9ACTN